MSVPLFGEVSDLSTSKYWYVALHLIFYFFVLPLSCFVSHVCPFVVSKCGFQVPWQCFCGVCFFEIEIGYSNLFKDMLVFSSWPGSLERWTERIKHLFLFNYISRKGVHGLFLEQDVDICSKKVKPWKPYLVLLFPNFCQFGTLF